MCQKITGKILLDPELNEILPKILVWSSYNKTSYRALIRNPTLEYLLNIQTKTIINIFFCSHVKPVILNILPFSKS